MARDVREFFRLRVSNMLAMERDVAKMNSAMVKEVQNPKLKGMLQQHSEPIQRQIGNLEDIVNRLGGEKKEYEGGFLQQVGERLGITGGDTGGSVTKTMLVTHRAFVETDPPQHLLDLNDALQQLRISHLGLGELTGLIVLAKALGEHDIADLLQQNIDSEARLRNDLEHALPSLVSDLSGGQMRKAA